jgi:glucokinase
LAAGIGFPGFFKGDSGVLTASPNLPYLHDFPLASRLSEVLGMPVFACNDAMLAALGEHRFGAGKGLRNLLHLTLGTGIGGGLVLDGRPYAGESGMAMEIGHLRVERDGRLCGCGGHGCLEAYASATAVAARFRELSGEACEDARAVYRLAKEGNPDARRVFIEAGGFLGRGIAEAVKLLDVGHVSISGGLSHAWDMLYPSMLEAVDAGLIVPQKTRVAIMPSTLGDDAGLLGAAVYALDHAIA